MSKRHNMVTRKETITNYDVLILTAEGKKVEHRTEYGRYSETYLKALEAGRLQATKALLLDLVITGQETHLYGLPKEEYFSKATVLD